MKLPYCKKLLASKLACPPDLRVVADVWCYVYRSTQASNQSTDMQSEAMNLPIRGRQYGSSGSAGSPGAGQTLLYNVQSTTGSKTTGGSNGGELSAGSYEFVATPGPVTIGWTPTAARQAYAAAAFAPAASVNYTVSTAASPVGSGTITLNPNQASYPAGTSVQVTANPGIGYAFANFSGNLTGTTDPATLVVNGNESVTANFTPTPCTLTINIVGSGTGTPASGSSYTCGTQVQVTATPDSGYSFGQFSGALTGSTNPQTLTLNTNSTVTATFVQGTSCTLSTSVTGSGSITVSPSGTVFTCGTQLTITAVPATYFSLTGFGGALSGTTNPQTLTLNANSTVSADFAQTSYPINITTVGPGSVAANPTDTGNGYAPGTLVQLTATPNSGAFFTGFSGDLTGATNPQSLTVNATSNVTATFVAATITEDAVSHAASTAAAASTLSWTHTLGSGGSRAVVIAVGETDPSPAPTRMPSSPASPSTVSTRRQFPTRLSTVAPAAWCRPNSSIFWNLSFQPPARTPSRSTSPVPSPESLPAQSRSLASARVRPKPWSRLETPAAPTSSVRPSPR